MADAVASQPTFCEAMLVLLHERLNGLDMLHKLLRVIGQNGEHLQEDLAIVHGSRHPQLVSGGVFGMSI